MQGASLPREVHMRAMPEKDGQRGIHKVGMIAGQHLWVKQAISRLQLLKGHEKSLLEIDHPLVKDCCLYLHLILQNSLLIGSQTHSEYMYFWDIKFNLSFWDLNVEFVINLEFDIHRIVIGLLNFLFCLIFPWKSRNLRVYVVGVRITIFVKNVLRLTGPLPVCHLLLIYLRF